MAAEETRFWVQVMEAGFGATLEARGFRRVSPRLYRLEGDGIVWEQFTYRVSKGNPNSLREGHALPRQCRTARRRPVRAPCARISVFSSGGLLQRSPLIYSLFVRLTRVKILLQKYIHGNARVCFKNCLNFWTSGQ
ncbi:MAG: hypothetical protein F4092_04185 [Rhodospirillaceae bacterium]|nr:hypothetical protein [Rhodospirillaceae bacterium]